MPASGHRHLGPSWGIASAICRREAPNLTQSSAPQRRLTLPDAAPPRAGPRRSSPAATEPAPAQAGVARQDLVYQHVRRLDADTDDPREHKDHRMVALFGVLLEPDQARHLDLSDLVDDEAQTRHIPAKLGQRVWRQRRPFR